MYTCQISVIMLVKESKLLENCPKSKFSEDFLKSREFGRNVPKALKIVSSPEISGVLACLRTVKIPFMVYEDLWSVKVYENFHSYNLQIYLVGPIYLNKRISAIQCS